MLTLLREYILRNWSDLSPDVSAPRDLAFIAHGAGATKLCWYVFDARSREPRFIARMPRSPRDNAVLAREYRLIEYLREHGSDYVRATVPGPLSIGTIAGHLVGIERYLPDVPLDSHLALLDDRAVDERRRYLDLAIGWLLRSQLDTCLKRAPLTDQQVQELFRAPISELRTTTQLAPIVDTFLRSVERRITGLVGEPLSLVFTHGDFQPANILTDGDSVSVIDWEFGERVALPLLDVFGFLMRMHARSHAIEEIDGYLEDYLDAFETVFFADTPFGRDAATCVHQAGMTLGVDPRWFDVLFALFLITEANKYRAFLCHRADRGYVYLLRGRNGQIVGPFQDQLTRQKHVWLLGYLAQNHEQLTFGQPGPAQPPTFVKPEGDHDSVQRS